MRNKNKTLDDLFARARNAPPPVTKSESRALLEKLDAEETQNPLNADKSFRKPLFKQLYPLLTLVCLSAGAWYYYADYLPKNSVIKSENPSTAAYNVPSNEGASNNIIPIDTNQKNNPLISNNSKANAHPSFSGNEINERDSLSNIEASTEQKPGLTRDPAENISANTLEPQIAAGDSIIMGHGAFAETETNAIHDSFVIENVVAAHNRVDTVNVATTNGGLSFVAAYRTIAGTIFENDDHSFQYDYTERNVESNPVTMKQQRDTAVTEPLFTNSFREAFPQSDYTLPFQSSEIAFDAGSPLGDSTMPSTPKHRLQPANMSFMERYLWDSDGVFREWGWAGPLTPDERKSELELRRTMLTAHQIGGFVTEGLLIGAVYFGQRLIDGDRKANDWHQPLVAATIASYSITGLLAILSPPPYIRRDNEASTTVTHKWLAWVHFSGMFITPFLAQFIHRNDYNGIARFHQAAGYITLGALTASLIVVTF